MTSGVFPLVALLTGVCLGCNARSPQTTSGAGGHEHSSGDERGLPGVETYAHRLDDPSRDAWQRPAEVMALLGAEGGDTAVDLGVGTGYFVPHLARSVGEDGKVLALDVSESTVEWVSQRVEENGLENVQVRTVAPDDPGLGRRSVDRILVVNTWHHISGRVDYGRKLLPALRRGGAVLIVDFTMDSPIGPPQSKRLTVDTVVQELEDAGFETEILEETLPHQYAVRGSAR